MRVASPEIEAAVREKVAGFRDSMREGHNKSGQVVKTKCIVNFHMNKVMQI